jgi:hypothetical protein
MQQQGQEPVVFLAPHDARTARAAGVAFARTLAGAPSAWFMLALDEQEELIRSGIQRAGYPERKAHLAADAFDAGARSEWQRIAGAARAEVCGTA